MLDDLINFCVEVLLPVGAVLILALGLVFGFVYFILDLDCSGYAKATGRDTKMVNATCYVQDAPDKWYSMEEYRNRLVAKGEFK